MILLRSARVRARQVQLQLQLQLQLASTARLYSSSPAGGNGSGGGSGSGSPSSSPAKPSSSSNLLRASPSRQTELEEQRSQRDLIFGVLGSLPSRREARTFLSRYLNNVPATDSASAATSSDMNASASSMLNGFNASSPLHAAAVVIRCPRIKLAATSTSARTIGKKPSIPPEIQSALPGLARALVQLHKLGATPMVILDVPRSSQQQQQLEQLAAYRARTSQIAERLAEHIDALPDGRARVVTDAPFRVHVGPEMDGRDHIANGLNGDDGFSAEADVNSFGPLLMRGVIPIITPLAIATASSFGSERVVTMDAGRITTAIAKALSPVSITGTVPEHPQLPIVLQKLLLLQAKSLTLGSSTTSDTPTSAAEMSAGMDLSGRGFINLEDEHDSLFGRCVKPDDLTSLKLLRSSLALMPRTSSAAVISLADPESIVRTLITDRPVYPSVSTVGQPPHAPSTPSRFKPNIDVIERALQRGVSYGTALAQAAAAAADSESAVEVFQPIIVRHGFVVHQFTKLDDPALNIEKLSRLLEASFGRVIDPDKFWPRLQSDLAAVIVAGDYLGAAIVTNEHPSSTSPHSHAYLDKFAVHPDAQGSGVADALWSRLRREFPVMTWRSRKTNGVNKWYFDRADGHRLVPGTHWTCFWMNAAQDGADKAGEMDPIESKKRLEEIRDYIEIAKRVPASFK
ncbi:DUF619-domain-containing protein [Ramicandelaber brevisporus]|nr:DUF619-domain-containing protein [Ramicandelaber brevisporus]